MLSYLIPNLQILQLLAEPFIDIGTAKLVADYLEVREEYGALTKGPKVWSTLQVTGTNEGIPVLSRIRVYVLEGEQIQKFL